MTRVAGLVLAAGGGTRLGRPKYDVLVGGVPLVTFPRRALTDGGCAPPVRVVVPPEAAADVHPDVALENPHWRDGMGSSLRLGLAELSAQPYDAAVLTLVDTPSVGAEHVRRLVAAWRDGARVAVATYGGARRTPVLIGREHWAEVSRLAVGDVGARPFLDANPGLVVPVECGDLGGWRDIDTPADLTAAERDHY